MRRLPFPRRAPEVSVVVPVYNKEPYLAGCIESVLDQRGVSLEVICVDDGSTDGSGEILQRLSRSDRRVKLVRHEANVGPGGARNTGIDLAKGRYLQFTDADDLLPPGALHSLHAAAVTAEAEVVRGLVQGLRDGILTPWTGEVYGEVLPESSSLPELQATQHVRVGSLLDLPELWIPWYHQCCLISRDHLLRHGIRYPALISGQDPVFMAEVLTAATTICVIRDVTYTYRFWKHPQPGFEVVRDQFAHAEIVKQVYGNAFTACWETYEPFIKRALAMLLEYASLQEGELASFTRRLDDLGEGRDSGEPSLEHALRGMHCAEL